jgi:PleD family two-component response regulator
MILLSGPGGEATAIQAIEEGAQDYLIKGQIEPRELMRALRNTLERKSIEEAHLKRKNAPRSRSTASATPLSVQTSSATSLSSIPLRRG